MEHVYISSRDNGKPSLSLHLLELAVAKGDTINFDIYGYQSRYVPERTCKMTLDWEDEDWYCSECGSFTQSFNKPNYCVYCGAKVVE